jgi:hypothetical protein
VTVVVGWRRFPAKITGSQIAWHDTLHGGYYFLDRATGALAESIKLYRKVLDEYPRARTPLQWAATQMNILERNIPRQVGADLIESESESEWSVPSAAKPFSRAI